MKLLRLFFFLLMFTPLLGAQITEHNLMPVPASVSFQSARLPIDANFQVSIAGHSDDRLQNGVYRAMRRLEGRVGIALPRKADGTEATTKLIVRCEAAGKKIQGVDEDESYSLDVTEKRATLTANTVVGALRGLETLLQLTASDAQGFYLPGVQIKDSPRYPWRGLLIDVGRHYEPMEVLRRNIDAMAAVKLNVLHWHLTEDQGFRIESKKYPKLHQMGSDGQFYTQEEARAIVEYARERGIRVVPEFDMPGHVQSWLVGHPELAAAPGPHEISRRWGVMDATFDPTNEKVYKLVDGFIGEMAAIFPDAYLHIGGDENNGKWWTANSKIQEFRSKKRLKDNHALQTYFNQRMLKILTKHGKRMMGWDEILHPDLPKNVLVQSWRNREALIQAAKQGYDGILSAPYYIDLLHPASFHYQDVIPAENSLTEQEKKHILGGEATMWSEWVTPETIDSRIWPRTAAIAEKFWSPAGTTDVDSMYRRLQTVSIQLEELGLSHIKNREMLVRRMAGTSDLTALRSLLAVVEPVKGYRRGRFYTGPGAFHPLTRLVDAANTDSTDAREFNRMVDALLVDAPAFKNRAAGLEKKLQEYQALENQLKPLASRSPVLQEAETMSKNLSQLSAIGLEALKNLQAGRPSTPDWGTKSMEQLELIAQMKVPMEFSIAQSIRELVIAVTELEQLKTLPPDQWRQHVKAKAAPAPRRR